MDVDAEFQQEFDAAIAALVTETGWPVSDWFKSGVTRPEVAIEQWRTRGPKAVQNFIDWYNSSGYHVWRTPDDRPAVELELDVFFGPTPVKMYIDCILENDEHLIIVDTKSGAEPPDSYQQLGFYACGVELAYGIRPLMGAFFMARGAGRNKDVFLTEPRPLLVPELSIEFFTKQLSAMERGRHNSAFVARVGKHCDRCDVAMYCAAVGGEFSRLTDPDHPDFVIAV